MNIQVTIPSAEIQLPCNVYYCDYMENCVYVQRVFSFPFTFNVPSPYSDYDFTVKLLGYDGCVVTKMIYIIPPPPYEPTPSVTPSQTTTPTQTPTQTPTASITPTPTRTPAQTPLPFNPLDC